MTMDMMKKEAKIYTDVNYSPKYNITVAENMIFEYYTKRLKDPKTNKVKYEFHGQCFVLGLDTKNWP